MPTATGAGPAARLVALRAYMAGLALLALALGVAQSRTGLDRVLAHDWLPLVLALSMLVATTMLWVTFRFRDQNLEHNLMGAVLMMVVFAFPGLPAMVIAGASQGIANGVRRIRPIKLVFNVLQWMVITGLASVVFTRLHGRDHLGTPALLALLAATGTMVVANVACLGAGLHIAEGARLRHVVPSILRNWVLNLGFGFVFLPAYAWSRLTLLAYALPVATLHWASRAYTHEQANRARVAAMQRASHSLSVADDLTEALPSFLTELLACFPHRVADLYLLHGGSPRRYLVEPAAEGPVRVVTVRSPESNRLTRLLADLPAATSINATDVGQVAAALASAGWHDCLAAPVRQGHARYGLLCLYDRQGLEMPQSATLPVLDVLATELAAAAAREDALQSLSAEREKLAQIVDNTADGIFTVDPAGVVRSWNNGMEEITGYPTQEMVGSRHLAVLRSRDDQGRDVHLERWAELPDLPMDLQIVTASGEECWLSCSYSRTVPAGLIVVARNTTRIRELDQLRDDFVAIVSHELRTPLATIKGWAATLLSRGEQMREEQRREGLAGILRQSQRLEQLILNILETSRIESGMTPNPREVADAGSLIDRLVDDSRSLHPDRDIRYERPAEPTVVVGRPVWVEHVVSNLLANAVKYSPADQPVDVEVTRDGDRVLVSITDRGPGIPEDARERIFGRFQRLPNTHRQTGTGLGLYIARQLARAMGGDVSVHSIPGAGSTFVLTLPGATMPAPRLPLDRSVEPAPWAAEG